MDNELNESLYDGLLKYRRIVKKALDDKKNESDTVDIVRDMIVEMLGFHRYDEVTSEQRLEGKFCDLLVREMTKTKRVRHEYIVEVKAVKVKLDDRHVDQAENYAAKLNHDFVVLTNAREWRLYQISMKGGLSRSLVAKIDLLEDDINTVAMPFFCAISRKGLEEGELSSFGNKRKYLNPFVVGQLLMQDVVVKKICSLLRDLSSEDITLEETRRIIAKIVPEKLLGKEAGDAVAASRIIKRYFKWNSSSDKTVSDSAATQPIQKMSGVAGQEFVISGRGIVAKGRLVEGGFFLPAGTPITDPVPSFASNKVRCALVANGTIKDNVLTKDFVFQSPSQASSLVLGRSSNGQVDWKTPDGRAYRDIVGR